MMFRNVHVIFLVAALASAQASIIASPAKIIQGPSASSTIIGPDGSSISSITPGGRIIAEETPGVTAYRAPVIASSPVFTYNNPWVAAAPYVALGSTAYSHNSPLVHSNAIVQEKAFDTVIAGPSGTIATSKTVTKPAVVGHYDIGHYGHYGVAPNNLGYYRVPIAYSKLYY